MAQNQDDIHQVDYESEHITFRSIWHAARVLRGAGEKDESNGFWSLMAATVLAYIAYEGFTNDVMSDSTRKSGRRAHAFSFRQLSRHTWKDTVHRRSTRRGVGTRRAACTALSPNYMLGVTHWSTRRRLASKARCAPMLTRDSPSERRQLRLKSCNSDPSFLAASKTRQRLETFCFERLDGNIGRRFAILASPRVPGFSVRAELRSGSRWLANLQIEPTRQMVCAIESRRRAAHFETLDRPDRQRQWCTHSMNGDRDEMQDWSDWRTARRGCY